MGVRTRIEISSLIKSRTGSIELPEEITLCCPRCGTKVADKGQCLAELTLVPSELENAFRFIVQLMVDCRNCGCFNQSPVITF